MRRNWLLRSLKIGAVAIVGVALIGLVSTQLWNWLMPALFGLHSITFWQALGLLVLSKIFFSGFRGRSGFGGPSRRRLMERWEQMTPEQREKFQKGLRSRCGKFDTAAAEQQA